MADVTVLLKQFTLRYQAALVTKAAVLGALTLGVVGAGWWRLHLLGVSPWWSIGGPTALSLASVAGLAWWLSHRWLSVHDAADRLDNTLGLQQRLVTTLEFASAQPPPALYPQLVDDTTNVFASQKVRVPRPIDRATVGAAAILLLLLLWPFKGTEPIRLANLPGMPPSTPPPQPETPPPQDQQKDRQQQQSPSQGQQQSSESSQGQDRQDQGAQQDQGNQQDQQGEQGQQDRKDQQGPQDRQGQHDQQGQQGSDSQAMAKQQAPSSSGGSPQGLGNQDAIKADIQELLKELSGELKDLQQQLAAAEAQAREAGTDTDAQLYGDPDALTQSQGATLPIQLKTDTKETAAQRPGGAGAGKPSGEISGEAPQVESEAAALAEESLEETTVNRQRVPPEYQSVFDRLYQRDRQPSETAP